MSLPYRSDHVQTCVAHRGVHLGLMNVRRSKRPRMRPTFEIALSPGSGEALLSAIRDALTSPDCSVQGMVLRRNAELTTAERGQHLWSPHLTLQVSEDPKGLPVLCGRFGPHGHVWTGFMAIYGVLLMLATLGIMLGVSQWIAALPVWGFAIAPIAFALGGFTYGAAFIGQGLGAEEMYELRSFVDRCVELAQGS